MRSFLIFIFSPVWLCNLVRFLSLSLFDCIFFEELTKLNMHIVVIDTFATMREPKDNCNIQCNNIWDNDSADVSFQHEFTRFSFSLLKRIVLRLCIS